MKFLIFFILLIFSSLELSSIVVPSLSVFPQVFARPNHLELSVWKIQNSNVRGTGFFISKNYFIINFHVISEFLKNENSIKNIKLLQKGNSSILRVKKILALSALHDLALLEIKEQVTNYLELRDIPLKPSEDLLILGYPEGDFKKMRKTGNILYEDSQRYTFSVNHFNQSSSGSSGSPVLDTQGQVAGIYFAENNNAVHIIKTTRLKEFIASTEFNCSKSINIKTCIKREVNNLKKLAKEGHALAQYNLAIIYEQDRNNKLQAFRLYKKAAQQGYAPAQYNLAKIYYQRNETKKNFTSALRWFEKAALQGFFLAQYSLGIIHYKDERSKQDFTSAFKWFKQAAQQGYAPAQSFLAYMYYKGEGREKNLALAFEWFEKAALQGSAPAQFVLANIYYWGEGRERNLALAFKWFKKAAQQGIFQAQLSLAYMYDKGEGTKQSPKLAFKWLKRSREQNYIQTPNSSLTTPCHSHFIEW